MRRRRRLLPSGLDGLTEKILDHYVDGDRKFQFILAILSSNLYASNQVKYKLKGRYISRDGLLRQLKDGLKTKEPTTTITYQIRSRSDDYYGLVSDFQKETFVKK